MTNKGVNGYPAPQAATTLTPWGYCQSGQWYASTGQQSTATSNTLGNSSLRLGPLYIPNDIRITSIGADVSSAGEASCTFRIGIYADTGTGLPGSLLLDAGTIAGDSNTIQTITANLALPTGLYWFGGAVQGAPTTQPTIRVGSPPPSFALSIGRGGTPAAGAAAMGYSQASVTAALPAVFTWGSNVSTNLARIHFKVA